LKEWEKITGPDDLLIDMHIPSGGGLSLAACEDSMRRAVQFFKNYFPDQKTRAIFCASWLFNTQFEEKLPDSNLTKFMRELYLFPIKSSGKDGFFFVFCRDYEDLPQAPRKTSLHRVMLDTLESGKNLRSGGMVFFNEDLNHFGEQYYRTKWDN